MSAIAWRATLCDSEMPFVESFYRVLGRVACRWTGGTRSSLFRSIDFDWLAQSDGCVATSA
jgi:hypothetical protein